MRKGVGLSGKFAAWSFLFVSTLLMASCAMVENQRDDFVSLHAAVAKKLGENGSCGPIETNKVFGRRFFVVNPKPQGLSVTVSEREFFSQADWDRRHTAGTNLFFQWYEMERTNLPFGTNRQIDSETLKQYAGITNFFNLSDLPSWRYKKIGVDVDVEDVDVTYPEAEKDNAAAQSCAQKITSFLESYSKPKP